VPRRLVLSALLAIVSLVLLPAAAFGWAEGDATWEGELLDCRACHSEDFPFVTREGPHMGYTLTSQKCAICHTVHYAPVEGVLLLRKATIRDNCMVCHDGSGGYGVYGTLAARGVSVGASHSIDATNVIPGGDAGTGGARSQVFTGENDFMSCNDCHSVHGASIVATFSGERVRFHVNDITGWLPYWSTSHLLKQVPTGSTTTTPVYGSDWCLACHRGRRSGLPTVMNHPVDCSDTNPNPFYYDYVAIVESDTALTTTYGTMGLLGFPPTMEWHNRGYVMPYPRTAEQSNHSPICQQCHEDTRVVGEPGAVEPAQVTGFGDGNNPADNPRFQCFPHETENTYMLIETDDNLCTNCHAPMDLP